MKPVNGSCELTLTGNERFFKDSEIIVSKTDLKGHITYANDVFLHIAGYTEQETIGKPHSIIRHPAMPRAVFKLLWDTISSGNEIFAYVINRAKNGDHYWVMAHVTPSYDPSGKMIAYHSSRRVPDRKIVEGTIIPLYQMLQDEENKHNNRKDGMNASVGLLLEILSGRNITYDEFILTL